MKEVVVDGDTLAFKAACATEYHVYQLEEEGLQFRYHKDIINWIALNFDKDECPEFTKEKVLDPVSYAYHIINNMIDSLMRDTGANRHYIFIGGPSSSNYRYKIPYPVLYKDNRPDKPTHLEDVRNYLVNRYGAVVTDGYETDDAIGIFATTHPNAIIASVDKDLRQIEGKHYHLDHKVIEVVSEIDGFKALYRQMLEGDRADNILGIDGIGKVTAAKMINHLNTQVEMERVVRNKYKEVFGYKWNELLRSTYDLLKILRSEEEYKEVKSYYEAEQCKTERQKFTEVGEGSTAAIEHIESV